MIQNDENWLNFMDNFESAMLWFRRIKSVEQKDDLQLLAIRLHAAWRGAKTLDNSRRLNNKMHEMSK